MKEQLNDRRILRHTIKKTLILLILTICALFSYAQTITKLSGKLSNCSDQVLKLIPLTGYFKDSILVNTDGTFNYETRNLKEPVQAILYNQTFSQVLLVAPGYDLHIEADVKDQLSKSRTLNLSGIGAKSNKYFGNILIANQSDTVKYDLESSDGFIAHYLKRDSINTRVIDLVFNEENNDPYASYFRKVLLNDSKFKPLGPLFIRYASEHQLDWIHLQAMLDKLGINLSQNTLNNEDHLKGYAFSSFVTNYPDYWLKYKLFPKENPLAICERFYSGKVYDYVVFRRISDTLSLSTQTLDKLKEMEPFIGKINDAQLRAFLYKQLKNVRDKALRLKAGMASPSFNLPDTLGNIHHLRSFKGKVLYVDLWASWCIPCREETPYFKKIHGIYKGNDQSEFIGIAVWDAKNRKKRHELIRNDKMDWLQLEDTADDFAKTYGVPSIPRFIIIDKQGNIVDNDAPRPSSYENLTRILDREIKK